MQVFLFTKSSSIFTSLLMIMMALIITNIKANNENQQKSRVLSQTDPLHNFNILAEYLDDPSIEQQFFKRTKITTILPISLAYFRNLIRVNTLNNTKFDADSCFNQKVPQKYKLSGFDTAVTDLVIFVRGVSTNISLISQGGSCLLKRRPIYGLIRINQNNFQLNIQKPGQYQKFINIMIHQIIHILGFSPSHYAHFYKNAYSDQKLPEQEVIQINPFNDNYMIITPHVKAYVQQYFNCSDNITGALLENLFFQKYKPGIGSHWHPIPYYNQVMIPSSVDSMLRVSRLTLLFLLDMGYYQQVQISLGQGFQYGKNKGCNFARGYRNLSEPEFCSRQSSTIQCSYYSDFIGECDRSYYSKHVIVPKTSQGFCQFPEAHIQNNQTYWQNSANSKCLKVQNKKQQQKICIKSQCIQQQGLSIKVTIKGIQAIGCSKQQSENQYIEIPQLDVKVECPRNIRAFCSFKPCQNWCSGNGYCVHGFCLQPQQIMDSPCRLIPKCIKCSYMSSEITCDECAQGLSFIQETRKCQLCDINCARCTNKVTNCSKCYIDHIQKVKFESSNPQQIEYTCEACPKNEIAVNNICQGCKQGQYFQEKTKSCKICPCKTCKSFSQCLSCRHPLIMDPQTNECQICYSFNSSSNICYQCSLLCTSCIQSRNNCLTCVQDASASPLQSNLGNSCALLNSFTNGFCLVQNQAFYCQSGCLFCLCQIDTQIEQKQASIDYQKVETRCLRTLPGFQISNSIVRKCQQGCAICNPNNTSQCTQCFSFYTLNQTQKNCIKCSTTNCLQCNLNQTCTKCLQSMFIDQNSYQCFKCKQRVLHCLTCFIMTQISQSSFNCTKCQPGYFLDQLYGQAICRKCMVGCQICDLNKLKCQGCQTGYFLSYLNNQEQCKKCGKGCQLCKDQFSCQRCYQGYHRKDIGISNPKSHCFLDCTYPCVQCLNQDGIQQCKKCAYGFQLVQVKVQTQNISTISTTTCKQKISQNCIFPNVQCSYCPQGYLLTIGQDLISGNDQAFYCLKCQVQNCISCSNIVSCEQCNRGYFLNPIQINNQSSHACEKCANNCDVCFDLTICYQCKKGFYNSFSLSAQNNIQDYICRPCHPSCKSCFITSTNCEQCNRNYLRLGPQCINSLFSTNYTVIIGFQGSVDSFLESHLYEKVVYELIKYGFSGQIRQNETKQDSFDLQILESHLLMEIHKRNFRGNILIRGVILNNKISTIEQTTKLENGGQQSKSIYDICMQNHRLIDFLKNGKLAGYSILSYTISPIYGNCISQQQQQKTNNGLAIATAVLAIITVILLIVAIYLRLYTRERVSRNRGDRQNINQVQIVNRNQNQLRYAQQLQHIEIMPNYLQINDSSNNRLNEQRNVNG